MVAEDSAPFFKSKYADLTEMVRVSRPALTNNGLSIVQQLTTKEDGTYLSTVLCHASGEWIESNIKIVPPKNDVQTLGSYITYLRRYSYSALIGVCTSEDEDDDGEASMITVRNNPKTNDQTISSDQLEELELELKGLPELAKEIMEKLNISHMFQLPKNRYHASMKRIREIKLLRKEK